MNDDKKKPNNIVKIINLPSSLKMSLRERKIKPTSESETFLVYTMQETLCQTSPLASFWIFLLCKCSDKLEKL